MAKIRIDFVIPGLADKIRKKRQKNEHTLVDLSAQSGVSRSQWYQLENEESEEVVSIDKLIQVEKILGAKLVPKGLRKYQ